MTLASTPQRTRQARKPVLPAWPVMGFFVGYPVAWVLGLAPFWIALAAVPMLVLLIVYRDIRFPKAFLPWALFWVFLLASALMIDDPLRLVGFGFRVANYLGATIAFVYVYNAWQRLTVRKLAFAVLTFFLFVVAGGYLGVLFPDGELHTPMSRLLPAALMNNEYVGDLVIPKFAEQQTPWGSPVTFSRPSAPFPYTNGWGVNFALLIPFVLLAWTKIRKPRGKILLAIAFVAALVPAAATLNRGMLLAAGAALAYGAVRLLFRGDARAFIAMVAMTVVGGVVLLASGFLDQLSLRTTYSTSTDGRGRIYAETLEKTLQSPVLGYGAPRPSEQFDISLGTQGHFWNVLFSHGLIALVLFELFLILLVWGSRRITSGASLALHLVTVTGLVAHVYYGFDGPQLVLLMVGGALGLREAHRVKKKAEPPPRTRHRELAEAAP
jgi:hypothetical protein